MKNILVFGGTRYFGKKVVEQFIAEGYSVTIATRGQTKDTFEQKVERVVVDRSDASHDGWKQIAGQKWDVVFDNLCFTWEDGKIALDNLKEVKHYLLTSSLAVYQGTEPKEGFTESDFDPNSYTYAPSGTVSYGEGKRQSEAYFATHATFPVSYLRFPVVLDDDDYTERLHYYIRHALNEEDIVFKRKDGAFSFVRASEIPMMVKFLLEHSLTGPFNLGSSQPFTTPIFIEELKKATGKTPHIVYSSDENPSPFSHFDETVNMTKLKKAGYPVTSLSSWLPALMKRLTEKEQK